MKKLKTIFTVAVMVALLLQAGTMKAQNKRESFVACGYNV